MASTTTPAKKPTTARKPAAKAPAARKPATTPRAKTSAAKKADSSHWGTAAIVGGVAAVGAVATAALFALRGSSVLGDMETMLLNKGERAHQADGSDSSASFEARIADEGTIPA